MVVPHDVVVRDMRQSFLVKGFPHLEEQFRFLFVHPRADPLRPLTGPLSELWLFVAVEGLGILQILALHKRLLMVLIHEGEIFC